MPGSTGGIMGKSEIVYFAKNVLGCGCDNSVFDSIDLTENLVLASGIKLRKKIVIGKRLLIYIADADELKPEDLGKVITEGIAERNNMGYNRLRLAIVTSNVEGLSASYYTVFGCLTDKDEKTHMHIVTNEDAV